MKNSKKKILWMTQLGLLAAIIVIMAFTPLGALPIPGLPVVATLAQIPVVIGAVVLGTGAGAILGGVFGVCSLVWFTVNGTPAAFAFSPLYSIPLAEGNIGLSIAYALFSLIICFAPRILIGVNTAWVFKKANGKGMNESLSGALAGLCGSLTNTILVVGLTAILFFSAGNVIFTIVGISAVINGIFEAIITPVIAFALTKPLLLINQKRYS